MIEIVAAVFFIIYFFLIFSISLKNYSLSPKVNQGLAHTNVSVIIPFRNEVNNLSAIFHALDAQDYPIGSVNFFFIDDHSTDSSKELVEKLIAKTNHKFHLLSNHLKEGKKSAIIKGIAESRGELIITTDADCTMGRSWISSIVSFYQSEEVDFIIAPVRLANQQGFLSKLQQLEFLSLQAITAGTASFGQPIMCNGANLAFTKTLFLAIKPYERNNKIASGDDVFFLHQAKKAIARNRIKFLFDPRSVVSTLPPKGLKAFLHQRLRWAGKSRFFKDFGTITIGGLLVFVNYLLLILAIKGLFGSHELNLFYVLFIIKFITDLFLLASMKKIITVPSLFWNALLLSFLYPVYSLLFSALSLFLNPSWKGRKI